MLTQEWETLEELQDNIELRSADPRALYNKVKPYLDYTVEYAEDRVKQIKENWDEELYIDCVSSPYFISKQVKNLDDELSEAEKTLTDHLDRIANYILYSSFDNEQERQEYEDLKEKKKEAKRVADKNERLKKEIVIRDKQKTRPSLISNSRKSQTNFKVSHEEDMRVDNRHFEVEEYESPLVFYSFGDKELNQNGNFKNNLRYWEHFGQHNHSDIHSIFEKVDHNLKFYRVAYEDLKDKEENIHTITKRLDDSISSELRSHLNEVLRENKKEYNFVAERLRDRVNLSSSMSKDIDPLHEIERRIVYTDETVIKELVYGYKELKEKYKNKTPALIWDIVADVERMCSKITLSSMQKTILSFILNNSNWKYRTIQEEVLLQHHKKLSDGGVKYNIDSIINKITSNNIDKELN